MVKKKKKMSCSLVTREVGGEGSGGVIDFFIALKEILRDVEWGNWPGSYFVGSVMNCPNADKKKATEWVREDTRPIIFHTVQLDTGQYNRLKKPQNKEYGFVLPGAFIRFENVEYESIRELVSRGTAKARIMILLNRLDNLEDGPDAEGLYVAQKVIEAIYKGQWKYPTVVNRLRLNSLVQGKEFTNGLQDWYLYYDINFREVSSAAQTQRTTATMVMPPFTNHADQDPTLPHVNPEGHNNLAHPRKYDDASHY